MGGVASRRRYSIWLALPAAIGLVTTAPAYGAPGEPVEPAGATVQAGLVQIGTSLNYQNAIGAGTGIVLSPSGVVLTNNHVVSGATSITATNVGTGRAYPATVIGHDRKHDIALLQLQGASDLPTAALGDSSQVTVGAPVVAIGNAAGGGSALSHETGKVAALGQTVDASDDLTGSSERLTGLIEVSADLRPGDSGGPLVDNDGQVIGLNTAAAVNYELGTPAGHGFAIPINDALGIAADIRSGASSGTVHIGDTAMLGVGVSEDRRPSGSGVAVRDVLRGGPASQAGVAPGNVITAVDGNAVGSATTLTDLLDRHHPGDSVTLTWIDGSGTPRSAPIMLATGPAG